MWKCRECGSDDFVTIDLPPATGTCCNGCGNVAYEIEDIAVWEE